MSFAYERYSRGKDFGIRATGHERGNLYVPKATPENEKLGNGSGVQS